MFLIIKYQIGPKYANDIISYVQQSSLNLCRNAEADRNEAYLCALPRQPQAAAEPRCLLQSDLRGAAPLRTAPPLWNGRSLESRTLKREKKKREVNFHFTRSKI